MNSFLFPPIPHLSLICGDLSSANPIHMVLIMFPLYLGVSRHELSAEIPPTFHLAVIRLRDRGFLLNLAVLTSDTGAVIYS